MKKNFRDYLGRALLSTAGTILLSFGNVLHLGAGLGTDSLLVFYDGLSRQLGITIGTVMLIFNIAPLLLFFIFDRKKVGIGSIVISVLPSPIVDSLMATGLFAPATLIGAYIMALVAVMIKGVAIGMYMQPEVGYAPYECTLMLIHEKWGFSIGSVRMALDAIFLAFGWLLGGIAGAGTIMSLLIIGPVMSRTISVLNKWRPRET